MQTSLMSKESDEATLTITKVATKRNDGKRKERGDQCKVWREPEHELVCSLWQQVFLEEQLDSVGKCLEYSPRSGLVWANTVLHSGNDFSLEPHHQHGGNETNNKNKQHFDKDNDQRSPQETLLEHRIQGNQRGNHIDSIRTSLTDSP